jgi:hypothetical protein
VVPSVAHDCPVQPLGALGFVKRGSDSAELHKNYVCLSCSVHESSLTSQCVIAMGASM